MADLSYTKLLDDSRNAAEDLTPYRGVVIDGNDEAAYPASKGDRADGIVVDRIGADEQAVFIQQGIVPIKIKTAAGISKGDYLACDTDGGFLAGSTSEEASAIALEAPGADGDIIQGYVSPGIRHTFA